MKRAYLGDSYDVLKRFWATSLGSIAPLYYHPKFVPLDIRKEYELVTSIPILGEIPNSKFGVLLDPHTGIPLPSDFDVRVTASHAPLSFIVDFCQTNDPEFIVCFDQTHHRTHELDKLGQLKLKTNYLEARRIFSFYYLSHAPFLFASSSAETANQIRDHLISLGIPEARFG